MAAEDIGALVVRIEADLRNFERSTDQINNRVGAMGRGLKVFGGVVAGAFAVGAVANFGKQLITAASDASEMQSKFNTVFAEMSGDAEAWATDFQNRVGGSRVEIKGMIADSQDMLTGFGASTDEAFKLSTRFQELGTDLASFQNLQGGAAEGIDRVRKGLLGEHENLKALGIVINETVLAQELASRGDMRKLQDLSELEKIELRYAIAVRQSKNAIGDAEKTAGGFANQVRDLQGKIKDITAQIGAKFLPIATKIITWINEAIERFMAGGSVIEGDFGSSLDIVTNDIIPPLLEIFRILKDDVFPAVVKAFQVGLPIILQIFKTVFNAIAGIIAGQIKILKGLLDFIIGVFTGDWKRAWKGIQTIFEGVFKIITSVAKNAMNSIINTVNRAIRGLNKIKLPEALGGAGVNIPLIPKLANGSDFFKGGMALVGERGPELVNLPRGSQVIPNNKTEQIMSGVTVNIQNANMRSDNDVRMLAREIHLLQQQRARASGVVYGT